MPDEMTDAEFLRYCETHADTPRCGFTPAQLARLARLAGHDVAAEHWSGEAPRVVDCSAEAILHAVGVARVAARLIAEAAPDA